MPGELDPEDRIFQREQLDADGFVEGQYLYRRRGCVDMPVLVWWGPPYCFETGEDLDRSPRWQVTVAGQLVTLDERLEYAGQVSHYRLEDIWPRCRALPVATAETDYRQARIEHARMYDPNDPFGHERGRVDLLTATLPF